MNHTPNQIPLGEAKLKEMRYNFWMGWVGIAIIYAIGAGFSFLFSGNVPSHNLAGRLFGIAPLIAVSSVAFFLMYHLRHDWMDIKAGYKMLLTGIIEEKFIKVRQTNGSKTLVSLAERTRHFIRIDGRRYLITANDYDKCRVGNHVRMYVTPYGRSVIDFEIIAKSL